MFDIPPIELHKKKSSPPYAHEYVIDANQPLPYNASIKYITTRHTSTMTFVELDNNWKLEEFFGTIAVINLPKATERLSRITKQLHDIGVKNFEVFPGIDGRVELDVSIWSKFKRNRDKIDTSTPEGQLALDRLHQGEAGCYMSHLSLIRRVKGHYDSAIASLKNAQKTKNPISIKIAQQKVRKYSRILILEDDCGFGIVQKNKKDVSKAGVGLILRQAFYRLPDDWDMVYFVVAPKEPTTRVSGHLRKLGLSWSATAYAVNHKMYGPLIEQLEQIEDPAVSEVAPLDYQISNIHHLFNVYAITPAIAYHQAGSSQISAENWSELWQGKPKKKFRKILEGESDTEEEETDVESDEEEVDDLESPLIQDLCQEQDYRI